jgi:hypothetical protein
VDEELVCEICGDELLSEFERIEGLCRSCLNPEDEAEQDFDERLYFDLGGES